jgi:hypothetical protein
MTRLEAILKDIESLEGKTVEVFGHSNTMPSGDALRFTPRVKTLLNDLMKYETNGVTSDDVIKFYDEDNDCLEVVKGYNTYNFDAKIDHHLQYYHVKAYGDDFIILSVHRYGDVRSNYTNQAVLKMTVDQFYEVAFETLSVYLPINIDGVTYNISLNFFNDDIEVESSKGYSFNVYPDGLEEADIITAIKDHFKEVAESEVK